MKSVGNSGFDTLRVAFEEAQTNTLEEGKHMNSAQNDNSGFPFGRIALIGLAGVAGYALWRNRAKISSLLDSSGIKDKVLAALPSDFSAGKMMDSAKGLVKDVSKDSKDTISEISKRATASV